MGAFDWQLGTLHSELQLQETGRDITYVIAILMSRFTLHTLEQVFA